MLIFGDFMAGWGKTPVFLTDPLPIFCFCIPLVSVFENFAHDYELVLNKIHLFKTFLFKIFSFSVFWKGRNFCFRNFEKFNRALKWHDNITPLDRGM